MTLLDNKFRKVRNGEAKIEIFRENAVRRDNVAKSA